MWIILAVTAAILWGFDYVFTEKAIKKISPATFLFLQLFIASLVVLLFSLFDNKFMKDLSVVLHSRQTGIYVVLAIITFAIANLLVTYAIQEKNATLASLIEISYPIFVVLIAWLLFRESALTLSVIFGGLFIFVGVFIIFYFNK